MTTYCAPCLADLALVREATTAVGGTASCMAHAVLLVHPSDDPGRRRSRIAALRESATGKLDTVGPEEALRLEVLLEEYTLAQAMESLAPRRRGEGPRGEQRPHGERPAGGPAGEALSRSARKRRSRGERERAGQGGPAAAPGGEAVADGRAASAGEAALEQVGSPSVEPPSLVGEAAPSAPVEVGAPAGTGTSGAPAEGAGSPADAPAPAAPATESPAPGSAPAEAAGGLADGPGTSSSEGAGEVRPDPVTPTAEGPTATS